MCLSTLDFQNVTHHLIQHVSNVYMHITKHPHQMCEPLQYSLERLPCRRARLLLQRMMATNGAQPDAVTFSTVASLLQQVGSFQLAEDVGRLMNGRVAVDTAEGAGVTKPRKC